MAITINGTTYHSAADLVRDLGISRQTLWRWRKDGLIPAGYVLRKRHVLFTEEEAAAVRAYATLIEPARFDERSSE